MRAVLDFVGEAYDAQNLAEFRSVLLAGFPRLVASDYVAYNEIEAGQRVAVAITEPEAPAWAVAVWGEYAAENPLLQRYLRTRDGRSLRFSDVIPLAELRRMPLFEKLYGPLGRLDYQVAFALPSTPELMVAVALSRAKRDYTERDCRLLELARPHLIQAYRSAELRERLVGILDSLRRGLGADGMAVAVVDADGVVGFLSDAAGELLEGLPGGAQARVGRPLPEPVDAWLASGTRSAGLPLPGQGDSLLARSVSGAAGARVITLERAGDALSLKALLELGLTPREAEVLRGLAQGDGHLSLAADLGISPRTVAKHAQSIHAKLGVSNRAQAVATAWAAMSGRGSADLASTR